MKKIFWVWAAVFSGNLLHAQSDTSLLDEAVVTANRYANRTSLTGKVVTVITREQWEKSAGMDLSQILAEQTGIYIAGAGSSPGKDKSLYLRGAAPDRTLLAIDGIPVYDPSGIGGNFDIRNLSLAQVERIEILKGSQSALYGSDAIAGVINIITKKSLEKKTEGYAGLRYGSYGSFGAETGLDGHTGKANYSFSFSHRNTRGINETVSAAPNRYTDRDGFHQNSFQHAWTIRAAEKISVRPFFRYHSGGGSIDQGAFTDELDYTWKQKSWQAGLINEFLSPKAKGTLSYQYNSIDRVYTDDSVRSRNGFDIYSRGGYKGSEQFADACWVFTLNPVLKLTAGADWRMSRSDQQFESVSSFGPYQTKYDHDSLRQQQGGPYAALNWNDPSGFNAEIGGRLVFHSVAGSHFVYSVNPSWLIHRRLKLFANLSTAYRSPSLYQLFSEYGNKDLQPESALTAEGGLQYFTGNHQFSGRAVYFSRRVTNGIFFFYDAATYRSQYINQDRQQDRGIELEGFYRPGKHITLNLFYTFVTGKIYTKTGGKDTSYFNLLRRPKSSGGLRLSWQATKKIFIGTSLQWTGERKDSYFDTSTFQSVAVTLGSYVLWDLHTEYGLRNNRLCLFLNLRNLADSHYTEISGYATQGINADGGLRARF